MVCAKRGGKNSKVPLRSGPHRLRGGKERCPAAHREIRKRPKRGIRIAPISRGREECRRALFVAEKGRSTGSGKIDREEKEERSSFIALRHRGKSRTPVTSLQEERQGTQIRF